MLGCSLSIDWLPWRYIERKCSTKYPIISQFLSEARPALSYHWMISGGQSHENFRSYTVSYTCCRFFALSSAVAITLVDRASLSRRALTPVGSSIA